MIKVLIQDNTAIVATHEIEMSQDKETSEYLLEGIKSNGKRILLGTFKAFYLAEEALLSIVEQHNMCPDIICVIPKEGERARFNRGVLVLPYPADDELTKE